MAEGNGDSQNDTMNSSTQSKDYSKLIELGLSEQVAAKLDEIYSTEKLVHSDLDQRALDALREFPEDGALAVLSQLMDENLEHVSNKSAYLCGAMKAYRQKRRDTLEVCAGAPFVCRSPDKEKIRALLARTGYSLDVTTGQRKYGGPPPNWQGKPPGVGCEIFCGKIPKDIFEDELIPLFEQCGRIWDLRLMIDPLTGLNRGYAFITFTSADSAKEAVRQYDGYEIRKYKTMKVNISVPNLRLFVGNIPKSKDKPEIMEEFGKLTEGLSDAIIYSSPDDKKKNRGFCFLEYESHKLASLARRRLCSGRVKAWNCEIIVDWADPQEEPDSETMSKVKVLYARNLTQECTEDQLRETFEAFGQIERVKKIKDYAFIHFVNREESLKAIEALNGTELCGSLIDVSLAKPPSDKRKKEEILRNRERRMLSMMAQRGMLVPVGVPLAWHHPGYVGRGAGNGYARAPLVSGRSPLARGDYAGKYPVLATNGSATGGWHAADYLSGYARVPYDADYDMYSPINGYLTAGAANSCYTGYHLYDHSYSSAPYSSRAVHYGGVPHRAGARGRFRPPLAWEGGEFETASHENNSQSTSREAADNQPISPGETRSADDEERQQCDDNGAADTTDQHDETSSNGAMDNDGGDGAGSEPGRGECC